MSGPGRFRGGKLAASCAAFVALAAAASVLARGDLGRAGAVLKRDAVTAREVGSRTTLRLLQRLGALHLAPVGARAPGARSSAAGDCPPHAYVGRPLPPEELPSSRVPERWLRRSVPVLSIVIDPCRLAELTSHPQGRGRRFERPAFVSYFEDGALVTATAAGLRLHGGSSRARPRKSFRLYFRDLYGEPGLRLAGPSEPGWPRVVVHGDERRDRDGRIWHFINPLAYDVARRLGGTAPRTRPVRLVLNGRNRGAYVLTERVDEGLLERRFGDEARGAGDWVILRGKGERRGREARFWEAVLARANDPAPLTPESVAEWVDLDDLSRWFTTAVFCSTGDAFQSAMVRDLTDPEGRWRWVHWDFDMSFRAMRGPLEHGWQRDPLRFVLRGPAGRNDPTRLLLWRLLTESPEYRRALAVRLTEALNHRLTGEFLAERLEYYETQAIDLGLDRAFLGELAAFFAERPAAMRAQMRRALGLGPFHPVAVVAPPGTVEIDGHPTAIPYRGWYFDGQEIRARVRPEAAAGFEGWRLDGRPLSRELEVRWPVASGARLEASFAGPAT